LNQNIELKSVWQQGHGKCISSLANREDQSTSYLIVGIDDKGELCGHDENWLIKTEQEVSNHINQYLYPFWAIESMHGCAFKRGHCLVLIIKNPDFKLFGQRDFKKNQLLW